MTTKHTPGDRPDLGHFFKATVGRHDVALDGKPGERLTDKQVAIRMIHTWNCHDELVGALEKARVELEELTAEFMGENYNNPELNAALKLAKGE